MKLNLGAGLKRYEGFVNIDDDVKVNPDFVLNLDDENLKFPFDDNTVEEIKAHHILEHIGNGYIQLIRELYRICKNGCVIDVIVPHHQHDAFYDDPTHKRAITVGGLSLFSKKHNEEDIKNNGSSSHLAIRYDVDFEIIEFNFQYDMFYHNLLSSAIAKREKNLLSDEENMMIQRLFREATNVAIETHIKLKVVK